VTVVADIGIMLFVAVIGIVAVVAIVAIIATLTNRQFRCKMTE
jgi:hypothetical protein